MRLKNTPLILVILLPIFIIVLFKQNSATDHFIKIPVNFFLIQNRPVMSVEIENKKYSFLVDLGSSRTFGLLECQLAKHHFNEKLNEIQYVHVNGLSDACSGYKVPKVKVGKMAVLDAPLYEIKHGSLKSARITSDTNLWTDLVDRLEELCIQGRVGWRFFKEFDCLFEFSNKEIILSKHIDRFFEAGYVDAEFSKAPLKIEKTGIYLEIETDLGRVNALLDTGATQSFIKPGKDIMPPYSNHTSSRLQIGGVDFGEWEFCIFDYSLDADAILGVDFFKKHRVCLDFSNQVAYINRNKTYGEHFNAWLNNSRSAKGEFCLPAAD